MAAKPLELQIGETNGLQGILWSGLKQSIWNNPGAWRVLQKELEVRAGNVGFLETSEFESGGVLRSSCRVAPTCLKNFVERKHAFDR
jgi:hypothetical protein